MYTIIYMCIPRKQKQHFLGEKRGTTQRDEEGERKEERYENSLLKHII